MRLARPLDLLYASLPAFGQHKGKQVEFETCSRSFAQREPGSASISSMRKSSNHRNDSNHGRTCPPARFAPNLGTELKLGSLQEKSTLK